MLSLLDIPLAKEDFDGFRKLIYSVAGISLSDGKQILVQSRLAKRLRALELESYSSYFELLKDPSTARDEMEHFVNSLTTNKTEFFRESHHFTFLTDTVLPHLRSQALTTNVRRVRIWSAACSSGEEPYTLAMTLREFFGNDPSWDLKILASDIDTQMLRTASAGIYSRDSIDDIPSHLLKKYFTPIRDSHGNSFAAADCLRDLIVFRRINLNESPWPIRTSFDIIFCRNVMIYFDQPTQRSIVARFCNFLHPQGYLVIGHSESLLGVDPALHSVGNTIYQWQPKASVPPADQRIATSQPSATVVAPRRTRRTVTNTSPSTPDPIDTSQPVCRSIIVGEYYATCDPVSIRTTVGSCIAACLFDPTTQMGGMNHFMLPYSLVSDVLCASYGIYAMEMLINALLRLGVDRQHLQAKVFGGATVIDGEPSIWNTGQHNIRFVEQFLETERIPIAAKHVGGRQGMQIRFEPQNGKAFVKLLDNTNTRLVANEQSVTARQTFEGIAAQSARVTLFKENMP